MNFMCSNNNTVEWTVTFDERDEKATSSPAGPPPPGPPFRYNRSCLGRGLRRAPADVVAVTFPVTRCGKTATLRFSAPVTERRAVSTVEKYLRHTIDLATWRRNTSMNFAEYSFEQLVAAGYSIGDLLGGAVYLEEVRVVQTLADGGKHVVLDIGS